MGTARAALLATAVAGSAASQVEAQGDPPVFHTVFQFLATDESPPLPILTNFAVATGAEDTFDGTSRMDTYGGFERYDGERLVLAVRENGIDESDPGHDAAMAAAYPDRSLIWINQTTGAPEGVALVVGAAPAPLDPEFIAAGGTVADYYFNFGVDDAGVVYVGYKNLILRYAPNATGDGFEEPTVAYEHENDFSANWNQWRWENFRVMGSGADTVLVAAGKTWRPNQKALVFTTEDGVTYTWESLAAFSGGNSRIVEGDFDDEEWMFGTTYPGASNGIDTAISLGTRLTEFGGDFALGGFAAEGDFEGTYLPRFVTDTDTYPGFPFVVSYSTPSWNSIALGIAPSEPGYIAVHDYFGLLMVVHELPIRDTDEFIAEYETSQFHGALGKVEVGVHPDAPAETAEVLWAGGIYGYGRYLYGTDQDPWAGTDPPVDDFRILAFSTEGTTVSITVPSSPGQTFDVFSSATLAAGGWAEARDDVPASTEGTTTTIEITGATPGTTYFRVSRD